MAEHLVALDAACAALPTFDAASLEAALAAVADARGVKAASLIHACRVAVTGKAVSPGLFDVLACSAVGVCTSACSRPCGSRPNLTA